MNEVTGFFQSQRMTNRKQCLKFHWTFKQLKNSKTTSEGVLRDLHVIASLSSSHEHNENTPYYLAVGYYIIFHMSVQPIMYIALCLNWLMGNISPI